MAKRVKKVILTDISDEQMNEALATYAKSHAQIVKINADLDLKFTKLREARAEELSTLEAELAEAYDLVQAYSMERKDSDFSKKKSMELAHGTIGFRTSTPTLKNKKGFTWAAVTNLLKEFLPDYVRSVDAPAKDKLLADRNKEEIAPLLDKVGVQVVQNETFYIELKKEEA